MHQTTRLNHAFVRFCAMIIVSSSTVLTASNAFAEPDHLADSRPNIIFMLSDDQSWAGSSVLMHPEVENSRDAIIQTPNLERLALEGIRFSAAYAPAPVCSPTRASLMTGLSPATLHWTVAGPSGRANPAQKMISPRSDRSLDDDYVTFAEQLQQAGYRTAHFGKWHLDGGGPERHGFDVSDGNLGNEAAGKFKDPNPVDIFGMAERAGDFMAEAQSAGQPFFIQLSWHALHSPGNALKTTLAKYEETNLQRDRQIQRAAITEDMDTGIGRVLEALDALNLADNTYVIFMSDNGGGGGAVTINVRGDIRGDAREGNSTNDRRRRNSRGALAGGKGSLWEGGIRVPLIVRGPGIEANSWSHTPVVGYDFYPTYLDWAGIDPEQVAIQYPLEGGSLAPLLSQQTNTVSRHQASLVFHFPNYQNNHGPHSAIRSDQYKLIYFYENERTVLFDLSKDLSEQNDLSAQLPEVTDQLLAELKASLLKSKAQYPKVNPDYDPNAETTNARQGRRNASRN